MNSKRHEALAVATVAAIDIATKKIAAKPFILSNSISLPMLLNTIICSARE